MKNSVSQTISQYDDIAEEYAQKSLEFDSAAQEVEKFVSFLKPSSTVLDIGCGSGRDTAKLQQLGFDVLGIDLSSELLKIAKKTFPSSRFQLADMRKIPVKDRSFDAVLARAVLHHVSAEEIGMTLREWSRVLKENGVLFIMTRVGQGQLHQQDILSGSQLREFTLLSQEELVAYCDQTGFETIEVYTWNEKDIFPQGRDINWVSYFGRLRKS